MKEIEIIQKYVDETKHLASKNRHILAEITIQKAIKELILYIDFLGLWSDEDNCFVVSPVLNKMLVDLHNIQHHLNTLISLNPITHKK
ncbi:hypothetical protein AL469_027810 [Vibrio harveyi]|nr:hypothetical protein AL469_027810 [Vibrio harveyi]